MSQVTHKVVRGDTLSKIAKKYGTTISNLVALNNIKNPNLIYTGQILIISGKTITGGESPTPPPVQPTSNGNFVFVHTFGVQANNEQTIFALWSWYGDNTDHYEVEWSYYTDNGVWFNGSTSTTELMESTYSIPNNALRIRFRAKPVSKKWQDSNGNEHDHWIGVWCGYSEYNVSDTIPLTPSVPTVELDQYKLNIRNDNLDINATSIEYEVVQNDKWLYTSGIVSIERGTSMYSITIDPGWPYKVRARGRRDYICGKWSEYSANFTGSPGEPSGDLVLEAISKDAVKMIYSEILGVESYSIQYAEKEEYLDNSNGSTTVDNIKTTTYILTGLKTGTKYYMRYKGVNKAGDSIWSKIESIVLGEKPEPPSTWSDKTVATVGDKVLLSWLHNTTDGSTQKMSELRFEVNGVVDTHQIGLDINGKPINTFELPTFMFSDSTKVYWSVRTKGVTDDFSEWSTQRVIEVYAPPSLSLNITNNDGHPISQVTTFPFYINATPGNTIQKPIVYSTIITALESYTTVTPFGEVNIRAGEEIFNKVDVTSNNLTLRMDAGNIDLENNINYQITTNVTMDSGLSTEMSVNFSVKWNSINVCPMAEVIVDQNRLSVNIRPYCVRYEDMYKQVTVNNGKYIETNIEISNHFNTATSVTDGITDTGRQVYIDNYDRIFCIIPSGKTIKVTNVLMSVYRRTYDGKFVLIEDRISGNGSTFITDPHPSLDMARYRISASDISTGTISYSDIIPTIIDEPSIVIQWDEAWHNFTMDGTSTEDSKYDFGSLIKLPYNISISENNNVDVSTVNYVGREYGVSYYGTNIQTSSSWSADIDKKDKNTLYALRRLSTYKGDVYVREPSGIGYWATINVNYDKTYDSLIIPITLDINRVEGGI